MIHLVLGGARSGKSRYAESIIAQISAGAAPVYIATAQAKDDEMAHRIKHHQFQRDEAGINWNLIECPLDLTSSLKSLPEDAVILVDCLTLLLTNELLNDESTWQQRKPELLSFLSQSQQNIVLVSNEVGSGIVPLGELSRKFVDEAGWLNQAIATIADNVTLVIAGLPLELKS
ncbi:bifunctional adenosylcobinamide kinase/adenosylcobinamide-phosphate guanylyltransferase [Shewanella sp. 202IG2-18]|uniref:bifunctional adenosylcobinamide kinase/adenosylcobinamide-phosphate guanylyltransferase n=1 Tax=Parashewanella hymeniacidonis TaxID=2807618 RepID=UPI0019618402|nr:bifunctional adenosylcobinamide kinase/adenosylcobinamide-phosphate guanylyltransferase [Parashewanella hymeniacidonis]MBM7071792.1 bifunctional adenosylcobinamide kinase/adenosylcobinamide-phosphate guanylyltransferase [Parashewanella hymeniacidonis]